MSFINKLFGPLEKNWCCLFQIISVINFIFAAIILLTVLLKLVSLQPIYWSIYIFSFIQLIINYIIFRILYSMCIKSLEDNDDNQNNKK